MQSGRFVSWLLRNLRLSRTKTDLMREKQTKRKTSHIWRFLNRTMFWGTNVNLLLFRSRLHSFVITKKQKNKNSLLIELFAFKLLESCDFRLNLLRRKSLIAPVECLEGKERKKRTKQKSSKGKSNKAAHPRVVHRYSSKLLCIETTFVIEFKKIIKWSCQKFFIQYLPSFVRRNPSRYFVQPVHRCRFLFGLHRTYHVSSSVQLRNLLCQCEQFAIQWISQLAELNALLLYSISLCDHRLFPFTKRVKKKKKKMSNSGFFFVCLTLKLVRSEHFLERLQLLLIFAHENRRISRGIRTQLFEQRHADPLIIFERIHCLASFLQNKQWGREKKQERIKKARENEINQPQQRTMTKNQPSPKWKKTGPRCEWRLYRGSQNKNRYSIERRNGSEWFVPMRFPLRSIRS